VGKRSEVGGRKSQVGGQMSESKYEVRGTKYEVDQRLEGDQLRRGWAGAGRTELKLWSVRVRRRSDSKYEA